MFIVSVHDWWAEITYQYFDELHVWLRRLMHACISEQSLLYVTSTGFFVVPKNVKYGIYTGQHVIFLCWGLECMNFIFLQLDILSIRHVFFYEYQGWIWFQAGIPSMYELQPSDITHVAPRVSVSLFINYIETRMTKFTDVDTSLQWCFT